MKFFEKNTVFLFGIPTQYVICTLHDYWIHRNMYWVCQQQKKTVDFFPGVLSLLNTKCWQWIQKLLIQCIDLKNIWIGDVPTILVPIYYYMVVYVA